MIKAHYTVDQIHEVEFLPKKICEGTGELESEQRIIFTGMPKAFKFEEDPSYLTVNHPEYGLAYRILNPYLTAKEATRRSIYKANTGMHVHDMLHFDFIHSLCAIQDGYADCLGSTTLLGSASHYPIKFVNGSIGAKLRAQTLKEFASWFPTDRNAKLVYILSLGAGFGHVYYRDPELGDGYEDFVHKNPMYVGCPHFGRVFDIWDAKTYDDYELAVKDYEGIVDWDTEYAANHPTEPRDNYAQGYTVEVWTEELIEKVRKTSLAAREAASKKWAEESELVVRPYQEGVIA